MQIPPRISAHIGRLGLTVWLIVTHCALVMAEQPLSDRLRVITNAYGSAEGLPQNSVHSLARTADGYLWAATEEGLARFDGVRFQTFQMQDGLGLPQDNIHCILGARDGSLWIGTYSRGLVHFVNGKFVPLTGLSSPAIRSLIEDRDGALWIGTLRGLNRWKDGRLTTFTTKQGLASDEVLATTQDGQGRLWIGTTAGLNLMQQGKILAFVAQDRLAGAEIRALALASDGSVWAASPGLVIRLREGAVAECYGRGQLPVKTSLQTLVPDADGTLWIGTFGDGLLRLRSGQFERFGSEQGLSSSIILSLLAEADGTVWVGTEEGGLNRLRPRHIWMMGAPEGLSDNDADAVMEDRDGSLWIATLGHGLNRYRDGRIRTYTTRDGLSNNTVLSLYQSEDTGRLWVGTEDAALNWLEGNRFKHLQLGPGRRPARIFEQRDGVMWVGTTKGLCRLEQGTVAKVYTTADGLPNNAVLAMTQARDGSLWLGTGSGFSHYQNGHFTNYATAKAAGTYGVRVDWVYEDGDGVLWLGSAGNGIGRFEGGRLFWAGTREGLNDNVVFTILEDRVGDFWLSTNRGICRVAKRQLNDLAAGRIQRVSAHIYDTSDGMRSAECNGDTQPAGWVRKDGELLFACLGGVVGLQPNQMPRATHPPAVLIEEAKINGRAVAGQIREVQIPAGDGRLEYTYTAIDSAAPGQVRFRYRLENVDREWVEAGTRRVAYYTNIRPGRYRFRVRAENADGLWSEASIAFRLEPHFYQTAWFFAVCVLVVAFGVWGGYVLRVRYLHRRNRELEEKVALRTAELQDANEQLQRATDIADAASRAKGEFLAVMSHEIRTPMNGIIGMTDLALEAQLPDEAREYLNMVKTSAAALLTILNDILDFSKIEAGKLDLDPVVFNLPDLVARSIRALALRTHQKGLELTCDIHPEVPERIVADPTRLRQILINLIGNAIKFTERGEVGLKVELESQAEDQVRLHFSVRDTGIGIAPEQQKLVFEAFSHADGSMARKFGGTGLGLTISSRLVGMMGGRVWLESELGKGSCFHFTAQVRIAPSAAAPESLEQSMLIGLPVLVVDDNSTSRRILGEMLERWRMKAVLVATAAEALAALREAQRAGISFALLLTDANMPGTDGFTLAEQVRKDVGLRQITILMLTSAGQVGDGARCRELRIAGYLIKPVSQSELLEAILRVLAAQAQPVEKPPLVTRHTLREGRRGLQILLAEDNAVNQTLALRLLEKRGHTVVATANGRQAAEALEKKRFDLVLMDVQMPVMDGFQATAAIREREKGTGLHVPIIAMTAHSMTGDRERCLAAGMDGYVSKPIQSKELFEVIEKSVAPAENLV